MLLVRGALITTLALICNASPPKTADLCADLTEWTFASSGRYSGDGADMRRLLRIEHPWEHSESGSYGAFSRTVTLPGDWTGPVWLRFYCSDTYFGMGLTANARFTPAAAVSKFVGHRFKELLVNGQVVWRRDIADDDGVTIFAVEITDCVAPGRIFTLTARNYEEVASHRALPDDLHTAGTYGYDPTPEGSGWEYNFATTCCFGDFELFSGQAPPVADKAALWDFQVRPADLSPLPEATATEVSLALENAQYLPQTGFPVTCGVPFHRGELRDLARIAVADPSGANVPVQTRTLGTWEDGSVKWALLSFMARGPSAAVGAYRVRFGGQNRSVSPTPAASVQGEQHVTSVSTGPVRLRFGLPGGQELIGSISLGEANSPLVSHLRCRYTVQTPGRNDTATATLDNVTLEESGPVRCQALIHGRMVGQSGTDYGRFEMRVEVWAGSGLVRLWPRVYFDTPERRRLDISSLELVASTDVGTGAEVTTAYGGPVSLGRRLALAQDGLSHFGLVDAAGGSLAQGQYAEGWMDAQGPAGGVAIFVQDFAELFPKDIRLSPQGMRIGLFAPGPKTPLYRPMQGEAKRHQVLLLLHNDPMPAEELARVWSCVQRRPRLFDQEWFRDTLAFRHVGLDTPDAEVVPGLHKAISASKWVRVNDAEHKAFASGIRHFPDAPWYPEERLDETCPLNYYYDALHTIAMAHIATADRGLFDELERGVYHVMDIDTCHFSPQKPWRVGGMYGPGSYREANHNEEEGALGPKTTYLNGILDYYFLTGDPDALETARLAAAFDLNPQMRAAWWPSGWRGAVRCISFALWNLSRMYAEFHQERYRVGFLELVERLKDNSDLRRGCTQAPCAQPGYLAANPGHDAIAMRALMEYYYATDDQQIGKLVAAMGMCAYEECTRQEDAMLLQFVLKRPQNFMASYVGMTLNIFPYTAWLTGDQRVMDFAREYAKVGVQHEQMNNIHWNFAVDESMWYMQNAGR